MTAFFVPGTLQGEQADRAYDDLRDRAELEAGRAPRSVRIYKLSCRRGGADCETCVGEDDIGGETVHAIFDFGDHYAICLPAGHAIVTKPDLRHRRLRRLSVDAIRGPRKRE